MSYAILQTKEPKKKPRVNMIVELNFEDDEYALKMATYLEVLAQKIDQDWSCCYHWADELAALIRNK